LNEAWESSLQTCLCCGFAFVLAVGALDFFPPLAAVGDCFDFFGCAAVFFFLFEAAVVVVCFCDALGLVPAVFGGGFGGLSCFLPPLPPPGTESV